MKEDKPFPENEEQAKRIAYLVAGFLQGKLTEEEHNELDNWVEASDENMRLFEELTHEDFIKEAQLWKNKTPVDRALESVNERIGIHPKRKPGIIKRIVPYLIAASFILALVVYWMNQPGKADKLITITAPLNDALPGSNKAVLTLASGQILILDNKASGSLATEGGMQVTKKNEGELSYEGNASGDEILYHTITVPKGGQYSLVLQDGSKVWLNAASSLTYPVSFTGNERNVTLKGEGYFEVATRSSKAGSKIPFIVSSGDVQTEVLGTQFNVNSYNDEEGTKITLVEGSVRVALRQTQGDTRAATVLKPGEQAQIAQSTNQPIKIIKGADVNAVMGWKNGLFVFRNAPIGDILLQISRWYDVEVEYHDNINFHFNATIERKENLSRLLLLLEKTGRVHFTLEGKKLLVKP
jgi:transmembrane sensor